jgi:hypothetical protein
MKLLNSGNAKTIKGEKLGFKTYGVHLSPFNKSGFQVCKWASKGCARACLDTAGRGVMSNVQRSRINKTKFLFEDRSGFLDQLRAEIKSAIRSSEKKGLVPCFRLNLTSDFKWEETGIFEEFPEAQFYDYTKGKNRMIEYLEGNLPPNYHLTYSRSEKKGDSVHSKAFLASGGNVAVVFRGKLPKTWEGFDVIDGDESDLRFLDGMGKVVGLVEKGLAKKDETGFVVEA